MAFELVPFKPFSESLDLWDAFFEKPHFHFGFDFGVPMDIRETKDSIVVEAEMPGMDRKKLDISITNDLLTIKGEKKQETKTDNRLLLLYREDIWKILSFSTTSCQCET